MPSSHCKQPGGPTAPTAHRLYRGLLWAALAGLTALSSCGARLQPRVISVRELESATDVKPALPRRAVVSDVAGIEELCTALGPRLGLLQVRTASEWEMLRRCAPELGSAPDFSRGIVIGLASQAGQPLDGNWPISLEAVRVHRGAGFAIAHFEGGSFLPDGTTYLETAQFDGLATVLMVDVNGTRFYPK